MKIELRGALLAAGLLALGACGDPDTNDPRGYTKAPVENPGWTVEGEPATEMAELGEPDRLPTYAAEAPETETGTGEEEDAAQPAAQ